MTITEFDKRDKTPYAERSVAMQRAIAHTAFSDFEGSFCLPRRLQRYEQQIIGKLEKIADRETAMYEQQSHINHGSVMHSLTDCIDQEQCQYLCKLLDLLRHSTDEQID
jgi:hypothetical protein